jgi:hypothetical protein
MKILDFLKYEDRKYEKKEKMERTTIVFETIQAIYKNFFREKNLEMSTKPNNYADVSDF